MSDTNVLVLKTIRADKDMSNSFETFKHMMCVCCSLLCYTCPANPIKTKLMSYPAKFAG